MPVRTRGQLSAETQNGNGHAAPLRVVNAVPGEAAWSSATDVSASAKSSTTAPSQPTKPTGPKGSDIPPVHTINLGLPPEERYVELAVQYRDQIADLIGLFDEVIAESGIKVSVARVKQFARLFLRRVHDSEQTRELRGISKATGVEMYLLVAFNVLLDLFMGCTSGGVRIREKKNRKTKMVHFRTLDWGMDVLRRVVVQLDFVNVPDGKVVARSITYVGFVGVLTGVTRNLSLSLNFRGVHNDSQSTWSNIRYYRTLLLVLFGFRPSIASRLRHMLLRPPKKRPWFGRYSWRIPDLFVLERWVPSLSTTSCYLIFSDGKETMTIEKDRVTGVVSKSDTFITATNHDAPTGHANDATTTLEALERPLDITGMAELVEESSTRRECIEKCFRETLSSRAGGDVQLSDVESWMSTYPVLNECTHYVVIMDPTEGTMRYVRRWNKPYKPSKAERRLHPCPWHA